VYENLEHYLKKKISRLLPRLTLPLAPLLHPGEDAPRPSKRLRPEDVLDFEETRRQLAPSILATLEIHGRPWSVVAVYSPYSPDIHVMVMETSADRLIPGPEAVPAEEGDALMALWQFILNFIAKRPGNETIQVGYNWSPRAWGAREERGGFQSVPTKWHAMLWGWPAFPPEGENTALIDWVSRERLSPPARRMFGENDYAQPLSELIHGKLIVALQDEPDWISDWRAGSMGLTLRIDRPLSHILADGHLFSRILLPTAQVVNRLFSDLTEALTTVSCAAVDAEIARLVCEGKDIKGLEKLRQPPRPRPREEAWMRFQSLGGTRPLFDEIYGAVVNRAQESDPDRDWWRKGFGYSWVLGGKPGNGHCICRLLPGVYVGPGGVVEAQGVMLKRPLDRHLPHDILRKQSDALWTLAAALKENFPEHPETSS